MKNITISSALVLLALCLSAIACTKTEPETPQPVASNFPTIPDGNRIFIHFGTSTYMGCMYSFSNCIWIGWGDATNLQNRFALQLTDGDQAGQYFGNYFPLTADFTLDAASAEGIGLKEQVIPAGFYPLKDSPTGKTIIFSPEEGKPVTPLVNPNNPQDNIGQLHNLALQVVLDPANKEIMRSMKNDKTALRQFVLEKTIQFFAENDLPTTKEDQQRLQALDLYRDYADYAARQDETRLSARDKNALRVVMDEVANIPVTTPQQLSDFVTVMTNFENDMVYNTQLDDPKMVLSTLSVLKYSRYYWYWKSISSGGAGTSEPSKIPEWVWADVIGLELGGPIGSAVASALVYWDTH